MTRILIIEDDPVISRVYSAKYHSAGFETRTAADGQEGLDQLIAFKPDLVHLDLNIPKVNGAEIIKHIRKQEALRSLPVVVLSNTYQNRLVKAAIDAGASECVSKATCTPKMMLEIVEKYRARLVPVVSDPGSAARGDSRPQSPALPPPPSEIPYTTRIQRHAAMNREVAHGFLARAPQKFSAVRERIAPLFSAIASSRVADLAELCRVTESLAGQAAIVGFEEFSRAAYALSALLRELIENPQAFSSSALQTIVGASDFLPDLLERTRGGGPRARTPSIALVIDDEPVSRRAVCLAMSRLEVPTISVGDPRVALELTRENRLGLVVVDVEMPGMNGFEFCRSLRATPGHEATPVLFVTSLADAGARGEAVASGGNDLIAKPFLPMELAVKTLTLLR